MPRPACASTQIHQQLCCLLFEKNHPYTCLVRNNFNFLSSLLSRRDWFVGNPGDRFSRVVACVACSTALGQIFQVQQIIILKTNIMRRLFIRYINGNHIIWLRSTSSNTQVIRNFMYGPQSRGTAGALIFWLHVPGMTLYWQRICPTCAWLQMTGAHNFFRLYAPVICDTPSSEECRGLWLCVCSSP